jgi:acetylglutamate kinase
VEGLPELQQSTGKADVLIEALPYIREFYGKTIVVKYGGNAMIDEALKEKVILDVVLMKYVGMNPVIVHGGGPEISEVMEKMGKKAQFVQGLRVTDSETMAIAEMVLGRIGKGIVALINQHGAKAVGLSGKDGGLISVEKYHPDKDSPLYQRQIPPNPPLVKGTSPTPPLVKGNSLTPPLVKGNSLTPPLVKGNSLTPPLVKGNSLTPPLVKGNSLTPPLVKGGRGDLIDIGFVGKVARIDPRIINVLDKEGFIPVISSIGVGSDAQTYNINADSVAGEMAVALRAEKLIILTDVRGIMRDQNDVKSLISTLKISEIDPLINSGVISGGMLPKVEACVTALRGGVRKTHIIDGRISHSLLLEIFTDSGIGTQILQ